MKLVLGPKKTVRHLLVAFAKAKGEDANALTIEDPACPGGARLSRDARVGDCARDGAVFTVLAAEVPAPPTTTTAAAAAADADVAAAERALESALKKRYEVAHVGESDFEAWLATYKKGPLVHKVAHYFDVYERHFARFRSKKVVLLEIGVQSGGSIELWAAYFPFLIYHGVDINPNCAQFADPKRNRHVHIGDATNARWVQDLAKKIARDHGAIDIVLDDGSHESRDMRASFEALYHKVSPTGCYVVEDCMTNYWRPWGGGARVEGTFVEFAKRLVDSLNAFNVADGDTGYTDPTNPPTRFDDARTMDVSKPAIAFAAATWSLCFYDGMVVFERLPRAHFKHVRAGDRTIPYG